MAYTRTAPAAHGPVTTTTYRKWPIARHLRLSQFWWGFSRQWGWKYTKRNMSHLSSLWQVQVHCVSALALFCFIQLNILSQVSFSLAYKHYITEDNLLLSGSFVCLPYHLHPRQSASTSSFAGAACQCFPFMFSSTHCYTLCRRFISTDLLLLCQGNSDCLCLLSEYHTSPCSDTSSTSSSCHWPRPIDQCHLSLAPLS